MSAITICKGATISAEEVKRVEAAMVLHNHNEYPKTLYKGKEVRVVDGKGAEDAAVKDGFGSYNHKTFTATEA